MDQFFALDGKQYLVFLFQEPDLDTHPIGKLDHSMCFFRSMDFVVDALRPAYSSYSTRSRANSTKASKPKVIIADLDEQSIRGICLCFTRNSNQLIITEQNIENV